jgi:hypothetical protein
MQDALTLLTLGWFLKRAAIGFVVGYSLRVYEHTVWTKKKHPEEGVLWWALMMLPQSVLFGMTLGYILSALAAMYLKNATVVEICVYFITALATFLAVDLRDLLRRIKS